MLDMYGVDKEKAASIAKQFGITGIPATFLLKDGKIVASNLRGDALGEAVAAHLKAD